MELLPVRRAAGESGREMGREREEKRRDCECEGEEGRGVVEVNEREGGRREEVEV